MKMQFKAPNLWGSDLADELAGILSDIDIPEEKVKVLQEFIDRLGSVLEGDMESAWGENT